MVELSTSLDIRSVQLVMGNRLIFTETRRHPNILQSWPPSTLDVEQVLESQHPIIWRIKITVILQSKVVSGKGGDGLGFIDRNYITCTEYHTKVVQLKHTFIKLLVRLVLPLTVTQVLPKWIETFVNLKQIFEHSRNMNTPKNDAY